MRSKCICVRNCMPTFRPIAHCDMLKSFADFEYVGILIVISIFILIRFSVFNGLCANFLSVFMRIFAALICIVCYLISGIVLHFMSLHSILFE